MTGGKSDFQSMLEDKRAQAGQSGQAGRLDRPQDQTDETQPVQDEERPALQPQADPAAQLAAMIGISLAAPQTAEPVPETGQPIQAMSQAVMVQGEAQAVPVQPSAGEQVQTLPAQQAAPEIQTQGAQTQAQEAPVQGDSQPVQPVQIQPRQSQGEEGRPQSQTQAGGGQPDGLEEVKVQGSLSQPLFGELEAVPVKVGDSPVLDTAEPRFDSRLSQTILNAASQGAEKIQIALSPEHLGNLVVEMTRDGSGVLHVALRAESEHTLSLLREHASTLGLMLQSSGQGEVRVEVTRSQESQQQPWRQPDQDGGQGRQEGRSQDQRREQPRREAEDFLHQLRLGLAGQQASPL